MFNSLKRAAVACLMTSVISMPAFAQETPTPSNLVESYESWRMECNNIAVPAKKKKEGEAKKEDDKPSIRRLCTAYQTYNNRKSGNEIVRFIFTYEGEEKPKLIAGLRTLVDVSFSGKPSISADEKELTKGKFNRCAGNYCFLQFDITDKIVESMKKAKALTFQYPLSSGRVMRLKMAQTGMDDALASLKAKSKTK